MTKLAIAEKTILFINNLAGDDLWDYGHLLASGWADDEPPHELFRFKSGRRASYKSDGIYLTSISIEGIQLYGFPFLPINVEPSDIEFPSPIEGIVVTQDMRMLDYFIEQDPNFHHIAKPQTSRLAWAKEQGIPVVLAVHHANGHKGNVADLKRLIGMELFCPVIWHGGEPNTRFFTKAISALLQYA